jgi:hypothetical protein
VANYWAFAKNWLEKELAQKDRAAASNL